MACADIVIAVRLEVTPADPQKIQSLFSVLGRSVDVVVLESELRGVKHADIVVTVPLEKYTASNTTGGVGFCARSCNARRHCLSFCWQKR
jgi:hypothetical protein